MRMGTTDNHPGRKPHPLRRQYVVNRAYQGRFILSLCCVAAVVGVVAAWAVHTTVKIALEDAMYRMQLPADAVWTIIETPLIQTNLILASISIILAAVAVSIVTRKADRALHAIEQEVQAIDKHGEKRPSTSRTSLWRGVPDIASAGLRSRMRPFAQAADTLERVAEVWENKKPLSAAECVQQLDDVIAEIERGCEGFEC